MNQQKLPNATAVLILGIASILTCCFYGLGIILGGVGLYLTKKDATLYKENPSAYDNYSTLNTGKILSIIGVVLGCLFLLYMIAIIAIFGFSALSDPELLQERIQELQQQ